jgi:hypothetical protein
MEISPGDRSSAVLSIDECRHHCLILDQLFNDLVSPLWMQKSKIIGHDYDCQWLLVGARLGRLAARQVNQRSAEVFEIPDALEWRVSGVEGGPLIDR